MVDKEWCMVHSFDNKEQAEACMEYLKREARIPLSRDFGMQITESTRPEQCVPWRMVPCWTVQIKSYVQEYRRSYEDVCNAARDFEVGWNTCMNVMLARDEQRAKEKEEKKLARQKKLEEKELARQEKANELALRPGARATKSW